MNNVNSYQYNIHFALLLCYIVLLLLSFLVLYTFCVSIVHLVHLFCANIHHSNYFQFKHHFI
jgi:hypothetical protein